MCILSKRNLKDEIKFSLDRIKDNLSAFSYSTLVYRSLTLTKASNLGLIDFTKCWKDEYSLVENALFTEPSDQAMWFYLRWLLLTNFGECLNEQQTDDVSLVKIVFNRKTKMLILFLNRIVKEFPFEEFTLIASNGVDFKSIDLKGSLFETTEYRPSRLWLVQLNDLSSQNSFEFLNLNEIRLKFKQTKDEIDLKAESMKLTEQSNNCFKLTNFNNYDLWINENVQNKLASKSKIKIGKEQLESLLTLKELEPDNKWLNLILSYFEDTDQFQILDDLIRLDPLRTNYYDDQKSKIKLEKIVSNLDFDQTSIDLSNQHLTVLYTSEPFAHLTCLKLTGNRLRCLNSNFNCLVSLKILVVDNNLIHKIERNFGLVQLEVLSIQNNRKLFL